MSKNKYPENRRKLSKYIADNEEALRQIVVLPEKADSLGVSGASNEHGALTMYDFLEHLELSDMSFLFGNALDLPNDTANEFEAIAKKMAEITDMQANSRSAEGFWSKAYNNLNKLQTDFGHNTINEEDQLKNRGKLYAKLRADKRFQGTRRTGEEALFKALIGNDDWEYLKSTGDDPVRDRSRNEKLRQRIYVDGLGGNGTLARAFRLVTKKAARPTWINSDVDPYMVADAIRQGIPSVRQFMSKSIFKDKSVDGVLYAYGTHHIPQGQWVDTLKENKRILKNNGKVVIHDFEEGTPSAKWYSELLENKTLTGHHLIGEDGNPVIGKNNKPVPIPHFTEESYRNYLQEAGYKDIKVESVYDPFIFIGEPGQSKEEAKRTFLGYLVTMFGLKKLEPHRSHGKLFDDDFFPELLPEGKDYFEGEEFWNNVKNGGTISNSAENSSAEQAKQKKAEKEYWKEVEETIGRYGQLTTEQMAAVSSQLDRNNKPAVQEITFEKLHERNPKTEHFEDKWRIIMPRVALVAVGKKEGTEQQPSLRCA